MKGRENKNEEGVMSPIASKNTANNKNSTSPRLIYTYSEGERENKSDQGEGYFGPYVE
jgi:hypothetical protein